MSAENESDRAAREVEARGMFAPTEPTAERAGDADDVATDPHEARLAKYGSTLDRGNVRKVCERIMDYPEIVAAAVAAQPAAVPDRAEVDALRAAVEALCGAHGHTEAGAPVVAVDDLRAVLGDSAGALAKVKAQTLRDAAEEFAGGGLMHRGVVIDRLNRRADRIEDER